MNGAGNSDIPDPDAFGHEGDANQMVVYELGYLVKLLHGVLAQQLAYETSGDFLLLFYQTYHLP